MLVQPAPLPNKALYPHLFLVSQAFTVNQKYLVYINSTGIVGVDPNTDHYLHMRIRRIDGNEITNLSILHDIKNKLMLPEANAIMVFGNPEDAVNELPFTYHLFLLKTDKETGELLTNKLPELKKLYWYRK